MIFMGDELYHLIEAATARGKEIAASGTLARMASYDRAHGTLRVVLANDCVVTIPVALIETLADAPDHLRAEVEVTGIGTGLHWPRLDLDLSVAGLLAGIFGTAKWMDRQRASRAGAAQSAAKSAAARANGAKGGRPRKLPPVIGA
jgi:Protein of unknown function (DUF2442)